jgi:hypothetical protein
VEAKPSVDRLTIEPVTEQRHLRTVRLLETKLEALAVASERSLSGDRAVDPQVRSAVVATRHAVELELLSPGEADEIWGGVASRHPGVGWCRSGPGLAA